MGGFHWEMLIVFAPVVIGFAWVWPDANRRGQPGWLWALLTIPFNWAALVAYLIVRNF